MLSSLGLGRDDDVEGIFELLRRFRFLMTDGYITPPAGDENVACGDEEPAVGDTEFGETGSGIGVNATGLTERVVEPAG